LLIGYEIVEVQGRLFVNPTEPLDDRGLQFLKVGHQFRIVCPFLLLLQLFGHLELPVNRVALVFRVHIGVNSEYLLEFF